jgi:hypothetical protein
MVRRIIIAAVSLALVGISTGAVAQQTDQGTAAEAMAMLQKVGFRRERR